jgi:DNA-binding response OmpR family regulator
LGKIEPSYKTEKGHWADHRLAGASNKKTGERFMAGEHILVVDDEPSIVEVVGLYLKREGYRVSVARDGQTALESVRQERPDLIVLDLMLPKVDGLEITRRLRGYGDVPVPIIMLTAKREETDRILGLEMGADDYVVKPFSPQELVSRVKAVLRRVQAAATLGDQRLLTFGPLNIDPRNRSVAVEGRECNLTAREFDLLYFLARHPRQVFTRAQLLDQVWGYEYYGDASTVTVHVRRLREKIEADPSQPRWVQTVWGVGYRFEP